MIEKVERHIREEDGIKISCPPDNVHIISKINELVDAAPEDLANFLESALEENDYEFLKIAVADVVVALKKKELLQNLELLANNVFK